MRTHTGERPYVCPDDNCDYAATTSGNLLVHYRAFHDEAARMRKKRQEQRVAKALTEAGMYFKREHHVDFKCLRDASNDYCRIDFLLTFGKRVVFLEVDEGQHRFGKYSVSCEMKRMTCIHESVAIDGNELPILFVRYNCNAYKVDGVTQNIKKVDREAVLITYLTTLPSVTTATPPLSVQYMYYDVCDGQPTVFDDPEYSDIVKRCCLPAIV
jgi:hypothetical protein